MVPNVISPVFGEQASLMIFCHFLNLIKSDEQKNKNIVIKHPHTYICVYICNHSSNTLLYNWIGQNRLIIYSLYMGYSPHMMKVIFSK